MYKKNTDHQLVDEKGYELILKLNFLCDNEYLYDDSNFEPYSRLQRSIISFEFEDKDGNL